MGFSEWLKAEGYDEQALTPKMRQHLENAWRMEVAAPILAKMPVAQPVAPPTPAPAPAAPTSFDATLDAIEAEARRVEDIRAAATRLAQQYTGNAACQQKVKDIRALCDAAVGDKKVSVRDFQHKLLILDRQAGPFITIPKSEAATEQVIEAAIVMSNNRKLAEENFNDQVLQTAQTRFKRGIGLREFLCLAAERNSGYRGSSRDDLAVWKGAFNYLRSGSNDYDLRAEGASTLNVGDILSNVANKFLTAGFLYVDPAWRAVCRTKPVNDFKQVTTLRLTGATTFQALGPNGEIKHATLGNAKYTNQASTKAIQLGITRQDIRNDDLNAFTEAGDQVGRGGGEAVAEDFWKTFLTDTSVFPTDASKLNYLASATLSLLNLAGLQSADSLFRTQTKEDGTFLGKMPRILLVPTALRTAALNLMRSTTVNVATSTTAITGTENVFANSYQVVDTPFLQATSIGGTTVSGSSTAWYLLADPRDIALIEVVFLDGIETPTIEIAELDFDRLGMAMRSWIDYGVSLQEYRAGVKMKGSA